MANAPSNTAGRSMTAPPPPPSRTSDFRALSPLRPESSSLLPAAPGRVGSSTLLGMPRLPSLPLAPGGTTGSYRSVAPPASPRTGEFPKAPKLPNLHGVPSSVPPLARASGGPEGHLLIIASNAGLGARLTALVGGAGIECHALPQEPASLDLARVRRADPALVLVDSDEIAAGAAPLISSFRYDPRLRWAQVIPIRFDLLAETPRYASPWVETAFTRDREFVEQLRAAHLDVATVFGGLGPARLLKHVASLPGSYAVTFDIPDLQCRLTLTDGHVTLAERGTETLRGSALQTLINSILSAENGKAQIRKLGMGAAATDRGPALGSLLDSHAASFVDRFGIRSRFAPRNGTLVAERKQRAKSYALAILGGALLAWLVSKLLVPYLVTPSSTAEARRVPATLTPAE